MPRGVSTLRPMPVVGGPAPCRHLAARVIAQAVKDVLQPGQTAADRRTARRFLAGSKMLYYWCEIAGLDTSQVIRVAGLLTRHPAHVATDAATTASVQPPRARA